MRLAGNRSHSCHTCHVALYDQPFHREQEPGDTNSDPGNCHNQCEKAVRLITTEDIIERRIAINRAVTDHRAACQHSPPCFPDGTFYSATLEEWKDRLVSFSFIS